jgi:hypothetical protein
LHQNDESLRIVKDAVAILPPDHPVKAYFSITDDYLYDAGLVDTFLHGRDRSYTVEDCIDLVDTAGLVFQGWLLNAPYYAHSHFGPDNKFFEAINTLPETKIWSVMERVHAKNACHFFLACHPSRPKASYAVDFSTQACPDYIPAMRDRCGLSGNEIFRTDWRLSLDPTQLSFARYVDGHRTIREIAASVAADGRLNSSVAREKYARKLFRDLWRLDFLVMTRKDANPRP